MTAEPDRMNNRGFMVGGQVQGAPRLEAGLHVVATPIGNLADVTLRALATLAAADLVLAEDTRVTRRLLNHYGIRAQTQRHDEHSSAAAITALVARIAAGEAVALVSDAGTPLLSDPGAALVRAVAEAGLRVVPVPGASALLAGLVASGLVAEAFTFVGFLPQRQGDRRRRLRALEQAPGLLVAYEAPHRLAETLDDMAHVLGDRPAVVARELTKLHEEVRRGSLATLAAHYAGHEARGEVVVLVSPAPASAEADAGTLAGQLDERLTDALTTLSVKDAATVVAADLGLPRREVYARAVRLAATRGEGGDA
jgi:16S rRNA (cytidine1402-2'-O)-methyltransferase